MNRMPLTTLKNKTPCEMVFGVKPSLAQLKVFGCLCFATTIKQGRGKFDPRAEPCVFLGHPHAQKAYKHYSLVTHTIFTSRDVFFSRKMLSFSFPLTKQYQFTIPIFPTY